MILIKDMYKICHTKELFSILKEIVDIVDSADTVPDGDLYLRMKCKQLSNTFTEITENERIINKKTFDND